MSRIESVSVCVARVPLAKPVTFSTRTVTAREYCLIKVRGEDGSEGLGYCYAVNSSGIVLADAVSTLLAPVIVGQESLRVEHLWRPIGEPAVVSIPGCHCR